MKTWVVDASVGIKWYFDEEMRDEAISLSDQFEKKEIILIVPEFFYLETANAYRKKFLKGDITAAEALETFDDLSKLPLKKYPDVELTDVALENALRFGVSVYDALYLSLAEIYVAPLITADKELFNACKNRFDFIEYLGDIKY